MSVYYPRLLRDGWRVAQAPVDEWRDYDVFAKGLPGNWVLRKIAHAQVGAPPGKGCYWDEHALLHPASGAMIICPDWEWADANRERLVWARG